jgi:hypothetical protein
MCHFLQFSLEKKDKRERRVWRSAPLDIQTLIRCNIFQHPRIHLY